MNPLLDTPSPWGEPARLPDEGAGPSPVPEARREPAVASPAPARVGAPLRRRPGPRTRPTRPGHPRLWERVQAAVVLVLVAVTLGAAVAGALGLGVWLLAAVFHHVASN